MGIVNGTTMKFFVRGSTARDSIVYAGEAVSLGADLWLQNSGKKYLLLEHECHFAGAPTMCQNLVKKSSSSMNE